MEMKISGDTARADQHIPKYKSALEAALHWHNFGFDVIPIVPLLKSPAVKWDPWLDGLGPEKITSHWSKNPTHELGFIVGDSLLVLDADSSESVFALQRLEKDAGVPPLFVVTTKRGEHHYFRRAPDTYARSDAHSTEQHPERIDVKTGKAIVVLPPSTGKNIKACWVASADNLFEVEQGFIDMVFSHNGRVPPRPVVTRMPSSDAKEISSQTYQKICALLEQLDPEEGGHEGWIRIGMAIHTETDGDDEGLEIFDQWSQRGSTYPGRHIIEVKWRSFSTARTDRCNMGTIINRLKKHGGDWMEVCSNKEDAFETCEYEAIESNCTTAAPTDDTCHPGKGMNPLDRYSLRGKSAAIANDAIKHQPILDGLAMIGQSTAFFAPANSGKTLITLSRICDDIRSGMIDPSLVYYANVDDSGQGLAEKLGISDEFNFHMLAEGYENFKAAEMLKIMSEMAENDYAKGVVVILDTIKKFTNPMDKTKASHFTGIVRKFVVKGGTVIGMAHTNKKPGPDGKPVYGGTSDIVDDFDCAYTISTEDSPNPSEKIVVFENIKRRGHSPFKVAYRYSHELAVNYNELLLSVERVDVEKLAAVAQAQQTKSDAEVIASIQAHIQQGINTKMKLAATVAEQLQISRRKALGIIERYTGDDPSIHKWRFVVREHGAQIFTPLAGVEP